MTTELGITYVSTCKNSCMVAFVGIYIFKSVFYHWNKLLIHNYWLILIWSTRTLIWITLIIYYKLILMTPICLNHGIILSSIISTLSRNVSRKRFWAGILVNSIQWDSLKFLFYVFPSCRFLPDLDPPIRDSRRVQLVVRACFLVGFCRIWLCLDGVSKCILGVKTTRIFSIIEYNYLMLFLFGNQVTHWWRSEENIRAQEPICVQRVLVS